jgi:hypothetical protein
MGATLAEDVPTKKKAKGPRPFLGLKVDEVSLVDKAANTKKFVVTKRDTSGENMGVQAPSVKPVKKSGDAAATVDVNVEKATGALKALITDELDTAKAKIESVVAGIGTMKKSEVCDAIWDAYDLMMSAKHKLVPISKSLGVEQEVVAKAAEKTKKANDTYIATLEKALAALPDGEAKTEMAAFVETVKAAGFPQTVVETETTETAKAEGTEAPAATETAPVEKKYKQFTKKRVAAIKSAAETISSVLKEIEPEAAEDVDEVVAALDAVSTAKAEGETAPATTATTEVAKAAPASQPVVLQLPAELTEVLKSLGTGLAEVKKAVEENKTTVEAVQKKQEVLDAVPQSGGAPTTEKVEKAQPKSLFAGVL